MACVPLISEIVSFASSTSGLMSACFSASAPGMRLPLKSASPSPISTSPRCDKWREVSARAHAALRRNYRMHAAVQHLAQRVDDNPAHARAALRQRVRPQQNHGAAHVLAQRFAHAHRVRAQQVDLQLADVIVGNAHIAQLPDARGHCVTHPVVLPPGLRPRRARDRPPGGPQAPSITGRRSNTTARTSSSVKSLPLMCSNFMRSQSATACAGNVATASGAMLECFSSFPQPPETASCISSAGACA